MRDFITRRPMRISGLILAALLAGCGPAPKAIKPFANDLDSTKLEADIDQKMGGIGTCVILADAASGDELYRYNPPACRVALPPCSTFDIPSALTGLDLGVITPATVFKWDGSPQPAHAWEADADIGKASKESILWWWERLSGQIGHDRYEAALKAYGYGDRNVDGPQTSFWLGPQNGGALGVTSEQQLAFLKRFYAGALPVKPASAAVVQGLLVDETRAGPGGPAVMSGKAASCASVPDGSRGVAWWIGRLKTPSRDVIFVASMEAANAPPGLEIERHMKDILADAGLWPAG